ncbi:hypothetical protein GW796_06700 [archaeon]|nr:hypothetical protein [archaeon]
MEDEYQELSFGDNFLISVISLFIFAIVVFFAIKVPYVVLGYCLFLGFTSWIVWKQQRKLVQVNGRQ